MGQFNIDNDHEFILDSEELGVEVLEQDPLNWDTDKKEYTYDEVWGGTLAKVNTSLEFAGKGYDYLRTLLRGFGFGTRATVTKRIKDDSKLGEDWRIGYTTGIDINKTEFDRSKTEPIAKVQFTQGGLYDIIKARYNDKFDLVSEKDAQGNDIGKLTTITEVVKGREIFRRSVGTVEQFKEMTHKINGADRDTAFAVPFKFNPNSDIGNIEDVSTGSEFVPYNNGDYATGNIGSLIFISQDRYHKRLINGRIKIKVNDEDDGTIRLQEVRYKYSADNGYEFTVNKPLVNWGRPNFGQTYTYTFSDYEIELGPNEAATFVIFSNTKGNIRYQYLDTQITITEDDSFIPTQAKALLPHEMFDRLGEKITGEKGLLYSDLFGRKELGYEEDGELAYLGVASGFWARGFDIGEPVINTETGDYEPLKQFNTSLKDAYESYYVPYPLVLTIETVKGKERFRIEKYEFSQQDFTGIRMGRVVKGSFSHIPASKAVETVLEKNVYTSVTIGFQKGGKDYEEVSGLSSPHGQARYALSVKYQEPNEYVKTSVFRADLEGYDLSRRKQALDYPDTDTPYDQDIFFRDYKRTDNQFTLKTWEDELTQRPQGEGVYSPDTMGNLLLTPFRCLLRHGRILATSVIGKPYEKVVFLSSNCFSSFSTTRIGTTETVQEDGTALNKELGTPFINGVLLSFTGKVYQSMIDEFEGYTIIDGKKIPNWYGTFEVKVGSTLERGRLIKSDISGEGKHEIALI